MSDLNYQLKNCVHTMALFLSMGVILSLVGFILAGVEGILWAAFLAVMVLAISPKLSPAFILSLYGGRLLSVNNAPSLYRILQELSARADLPVTPSLYYLPSQVMNAFSVGSSSNPAIGLSDSLLNSLTIREITAVLAHEVSHIQHNDVRVMSYADIISRITNILAFTGFLLIFLNLPLFLLGMVTFSWPALIVLVIAPSVMNYLQLSLSRMKEFNADRQAVLLTGDPEGLAMALSKLDAYGSSIFDVIFGRKHSRTTPSMLRTHPDTEERIQRLMDLTEHSEQRLDYSDHDSFDIPVHLQKTVRKPRWHFNGLWY